MVEEKVSCLICGRRNLTPKELSMHTKFFHDPFKIRDDCPDCGHALKHEEGCITCPTCGWSKC